MPSAPPPPPLPPEMIQALQAIKANRISRLALALSVLFSALALAASTVGLILQSDINDEQRLVNDHQRRAIEDQILANNEHRMDESMEYAIRVSWWLSIDRNTMTIQNRSTVPIREVTLRYRAKFTDEPDRPWSDLPLHDDSPVAYLSMIPPCTSALINVGKLKDRFVGSPSADDIYGIESLAWERVDFFDVHGSWSVGPAGEKPQTLKTGDRLEFGEGDWPFAQNLITEEPAADCGSG